MSGEIFGCEVMLVFAGRTVHDSDLILFRPSPQTAAEAPRHAHQMIVVEILIRTIQGAPPEAKASAKLPPPEVCVEDHTIDTIVTALQEIAVDGAQLVRHVRSINTTCLPPQQLTASCPSGPLFRGAVPEKA